MNRLTGHETIQIAVRYAQVARTFRATERRAGTEVRVTGITASTGTALVSVQYLLANSTVSAGTGP